MQTYFLLLPDKDWSSRTKLKISGISLELRFNFYQCKLTEGLEHEENLHTESLTAYHDTLEWYNKQLFSDKEGEEDLLLVDKDLIQMDDDNDYEDPNIVYHRR